jgi:hypothetical protein
MHQEISIQYYYSGQLGSDRRVASSIVVQGMGRQVSSAFTLFPLLEACHLTSLIFSGLYVNKRYQLFPASSGIKCEERIVAGRQYKFGITRTEGGDVSLYLHGGKCASGSPLFSGGYALDTTYVTFFRDEGTENTGGILKHIQFWDRALTPVEMATECGCTLTQAAAACKNTVVYSAPYFRISYSSVWNNDAVFTRFAYLIYHCPRLMFFCRFRSDRAMVLVVSSRHKHGLFGQMSSASGCKWIQARCKALQE